MQVVKVSEVSGTVLDWLVAKCEWVQWTFEASTVAEIIRDCRYSTDWAQGGPIIEREDIFFSPLPDKGLRAFQFKDGQYLNILDCWPYKEQPTRLLLGMRCYVISKLGETAEVPEDLLY